MIRRSRWYVGPCGYSCWLPVAVTQPLESSTSSVSIIAWWIPGLSLPYPLSPRSYIRSRILIRIRPRSYRPRPSPSPHPRPSSPFPFLSSSSSSSSPSSLSPPPSLFCPVFPSVRHGRTGAGSNLRPELLPTLRCYPLTAERDGAACGMIVPAVKRTKTTARRRASSAPPPRPRCRLMDSSECIFELCSTRLMVRSLTRVCTSRPVSPRVDTATQDKEERVSSWQGTSPGAYCSSARLF